MKSKNILIFGILIISAAALVFTGCRPADYTAVTDEDVQGLRDYVVSSYYMLNGDVTASAGLSAGRATVPIHSYDPASLPFTSGSKTDYPEIGQNTTWTVAAAGTNIYKITAVTDYVTNGAIEYTEEIYYIKDTDENGEWTTADEVVDPTGAVNNLHRDKFITVFKDGSVRYEEIEKSSSDAAATGAADPGKYAAFTAPADATIPASEADVITTDPDAWFSSKVNYQQEVFKRFSFWNVLNKVVVGTRFYTEHGADPANPVRTSISYERTIERENKGLGGIVKLLKDALYDPTTLDIDNATLAETVIWYKIDTDGTKTIVQKTKVVNDFGDNFYLTAAGGESVISPAP